VLYSARDRPDRPTDDRTSKDPFPASIDVCCLGWGVAPMTTSTMVDININPASLMSSRVGITTPVLSTKSINVSVPSLQKPKTTAIPARIDLEPIYTALKSSIGAEGWAIYKEVTTQFLIGALPSAMSFFLMSTSN
jgi:hypothetical protein